MAVVKLVAIGLAAGICSGFFGVGGAIIIVPGLIYWVGYSQHLATGTSLAILLPPVGLAAVLEYYRHGNVNLRAAILIAVPMFLGGFLGAFVSNKLSESYLRLIFGLFILFMGISLVYGACRRLGWI
jgi:uncharacterized membrane protein YfcA